MGSVRCPTLVLRRAENEFIDERHARYVAEHVTGARYVELHGGGAATTLDAAEDIPHRLALRRRPASGCSRRSCSPTSSARRSSRPTSATPAGALCSSATTRCSSARSHATADAWSKSLGDGALALFDGPSRALGCALAIRTGLAELGLHTRAGLHTGECERLAGEDVGGIAVHIAARIAALAGPGEVLASSTVRDLSVGRPSSCTAAASRS